ncbi:hypothetical protein C6P40_003391 [Pichia californica]|uniref:DUF1749-domain-containing protein n=1 Tax=Pichia californica TaxID=460514 RepID=A0A9P6WQ97_9ASCO|nr:hypothetical protein C6P42_004455 [[Candida] californica]KAG0690277.1 hypothetical protein C6P40_003391 [[Candida] californica]
MVAINGTLLEYSTKQFCFEFGNLKSKNVLIFVAGLGDRFATVPYLPLLSTELNKIGWSLIQIEFSSSHIGWGTGSLKRDNDEISKLIKFLKSENGGLRNKIGIMGHSTGCQNTIYYFTRAERNSDYIPLDFGILQAGISDREAAYLLMSIDLIEEANNLAKKFIDQGNPNELMPYKYTKNFFNTPINAYRWYALYSKNGDDDYFSSYLTDDDFKSTYGKFDKPLLVLYSAADEYVPDNIDKELLMKRFEAATTPGMWSPYSKLIDGGLHALGKTSKPTAIPDAVNTTIKFIQSL